MGEGVRKLSNLFYKDINPNLQSLYLQIPSCWELLGFNIWVWEGHKASVYGTPALWLMFSINVRLASEAWIICPLHREKNWKDRGNLNKKLLVRPMVEKMKNNHIILLWAFTYQNWNIKSNLHLNEPFLVVSRFPLAEDAWASAEWSCAGHNALIFLYVSHCSWWEGYDGEWNKYPCHSGAYILVAETASK